MITVIMYHYIRDLSRSRFPRIKARLSEEFEGQLDYIERYYKVCSLQSIIRALDGKDELPPNACHLTFDDGFAEHYTTVFPALQERGLTASFYPSALPVREQRVLDVHKVQFILASCDDVDELLANLLREIDVLRDEFEIEPTEHLRLRYAHAGRWDSEEVVLIKRLLQARLPKQVRERLIESLFDAYVGVDESVLSRELYMDIPQMRCMARADMSFGAHGYSHQWLGTLTEGQQEMEIDESLSLLADIHDESSNGWAICYPSNSRSDETLRLLRKRGFRVGFLAEPGIAEQLSKPLELPRLDTNDLPTDGRAVPGRWASGWAETVTR